MYRVRSRLCMRVPGEPAFLESTNFQVSEVTPESEESFHILQKFPASKKSLTPKKPLFPKLTKDCQSQVSLALKSLDLRRRGAAPETPEVAAFRARRRDQSMMRWEASEAKEVRIKVLDIDSIDMNHMHDMFLHTLVRRVHAENCVKLIGRIGLFRDKQSTQSHVNLSDAAAQIFGEFHGPELVALFSRCHSTLGLPYALDYVRRFGKFSKSFLAKQIDRSHRPRLFDFARYPAGKRPLPPIVSHPNDLWSYARMLPSCSAKRYLVQHLLAQQVKNGNTSLPALDRSIKAEARLAEGLVTLPSSDRPAAIDDPNFRKFGADSEPGNFFDLQNIKVHDLESQVLVKVAPAGENVEIETLESGSFWKPKKRTFYFQGKKYRLGDRWMRVFRKFEDFGKDRRQLRKFKKHEKQVIRRIDHFKNVRKLKARVVSN